MKGNKQEPRCGVLHTVGRCSASYYFLSVCKTGFSRQMVSILQEECIDFTTFDILKDEEVRVCVVL